MAQAFGVAEQRLGVREEVMADGHGLRALQVGVAGQRPRGVLARLDRQGSGDLGDGLHQVTGGRTAVQPQVEHHLVIARPPRVKRSPGRCDLSQPTLHGGVDVLVGLVKGEGAGFELGANLSQTALDGSELAAADDAGGSKPAGVREAAGDVEPIEVEVGLERRGELLELREQAAFEPATPELLARGRLLARYGVSLLRSPSRPFMSREWSWPCTCDAVLTPIPHSLMKPAAAV